MFYNRNLALDGETALKLFKIHSSEINLVLLDLGLGGEGKVSAQQLMDYFVDTLGIETIILTGQHSLEPVYTTNGKQLTKIKKGSDRALSLIKELRNSY